MDKILNKYITNGCFIFKIGDILSKVCDAPDEAGIYYILQIQKGIKKLVYIGASGTINQRGEFSKQLLYGRINNTQEGMKRQVYFENKIKELSLDCLKIYWHVTFDENNSHIPTYVESLLLQNYYDEYKCLPDWNKSF